MKRTALLVVLLQGIGCSAPDPRPTDELIREGDTYLHPTTHEPYSGPVFTTFAHAPLQIEKRASLREGHYDGPFEWYFGNRQLSVREVYRGGLKDGPYEWYFESGRLYEKGTYVDGHLEGPYQAYYETGQLYERGTYRDGEFDGPRQWFLAEQLIEQVTYVRGRIRGPYERLGADPSLDLKGWLEDGQPCGAWAEGEVTVTYPPCGRDS
jgi:hypothetical protein